jgi:FKBP-type peptidyl-prolyl cis-trans isomerase 2
MRPKKKNMVAENGKKVTFHFTLTADEKVIQTSEGQQPMSYTHGSGQIIPGLAAEIDGMNEGEEKSVIVSAQPLLIDIVQHDPHMLLFDLSG